MSGALETLRQAVAAALNAGGVNAVAAMEPEARRRWDGPVAAVSLAGEECGPGGFQHYLGVWKIPDTGLEEEVYGRKAQFTLDLDLYAPRSGGEGACRDALAQALEQNKAYEDEINQTDNTALNQAPLEVRDKMNQFRMNAEFAEEASTLRFPQFTLETRPSLFSDSYETLEKEHLEGGFSLRDKDAHIDFNTVSAEMARVDVDDSKDSAAKAWLLSGSDSSYFREWFNVQPSEKRLSLCKGMIKGRLSKMNCINDRELDEYINRVIGTLIEDQLSEL